MSQTTTERISLQSLSTSNASSHDVLSMTSTNVYHHHGILNLPSQDLHNSQDGASRLTYRGAEPDRRSVKSIENIMYQNEITTDFPDGGIRAWLVVLGCFIGLIAVFGIPNAMGAIEAYVSTNQLLEILHSSVSWIFSINLAMQCFGGVFFGELFDRYGTTWPLLIATCIMTTGLLLTAELTQLYQFVLLFGVLTGLGNSVAQSPLIGSVSHWFLKKRGTALSIATVGGLVGGTIFTVMLQNLYTSVGFKWAMRILLFVCLGCMILGTLLVKERKPEPVVKTKFELIPFLKGALDFTIVKDIRFVTLTLAACLAEIIAMTILTYLASYAIGMSIPSSKAYLILTIVNLCGIPSRFFSGILADKYGRFNMMIASGTLSTIAIFALWLPLKQSFSILTAFAVVFGISSSAVISLIPVCAGQICSADRFGKVYGTLYFFLAFMILLGTYVSSVVIGDATPKDFKNFIFFEGAVGFASVVMWVYARYTVVGFRWCKF
ncbi:uncharacterized protein KQ657_002198 [Scheffersomyces spartinae]|uniref:Major facilitator superfamily (MFS) profile domain-containing protein n=1 Tax=Scheffersomyces spartinae TaxID=45513 RepID=A0A9P8AKG1_9ASCO|nr:uncharacterized protein KQ657_002198 [Scheffersomyces spartinae]KAG7195813.1 hypothetical protein KQ657_002198 [Scheffersomyces spartinae]